MDDLAGKVALVTGAAQGIGKAIADGLAAHGARIVVADLRGAGEAAARYAGGVGLEVDVADEDAVARMVGETMERCGALDILVNNAGLYATLAMRPFTEIPLEEWRRVMDVNVASMFLTCRAAVPVMRARGGGAIVNISSGTPFRGVPFLLHYVTSKGAIIAFTRALARELGKDSIRVNCVAPGFTMSQGVLEQPEVVEKLRDVSIAARTIQRDQEPEDVVGAVVYLAGPAASFVTGAARLEGPSRALVPCSQAGFPDGNPALGSLRTGCAGREGRSLKGSPAARLEGPSRALGSQGRRRGEACPLPRARSGAVRGPGHAGPLWSPTCHARGRLGER